MLAEVTGFDNVFLAVRDEDGRHFYIEGASQPILLGKTQDVLFPLGSGLVGWSFKNSAPLFTGDKEASGASSPLFGQGGDTAPMASVILLPMTVSKATRGVLGFASEVPLVLNDSLKSFVQTVAEHLALFLENLYLKNRLRATAAPLESK